MEVKIMKNGLNFVNNFFDDLMDDVDIWSPFSAFRPFKNVNKMNVNETDSEYTIELPVPGLDKADIKVQVSDGILNVSYDKEVKDEENDNDNKKVIRSSWSVESFNDSYELPDNVKEDEITATVENGVLKVTVPKDKTLPAKPEVKTIDVK